MAKGGAITCALITLFFLGGLAVLIAWLSDRMKSPSFTIDQAAISGYNFTADNHLNATIALAIRTQNRDSKFNIKYEVVVVSVYHNGYTLAYESVAPFKLHHGDHFSFNAGPTAKGVLIAEGGVADNIRRETKDGKLSLEVRVRASIRFEAKGWKHRHYTLKVICSPVMINFTSMKSFEATRCDVDRF